MKKLILLLIAFSFALAMPAFANVVETDGNSYTATVPSYSVVTGDWYSAGTQKQISLDGNRITFTYESDGLAYYNTNLHLFYYVLTKPDGSKEFLKQYQWDERNEKSSVEIKDPYYSSGTRTHTFSNVKLPEQNFPIEISESGHYKVELKQLSIPRILLDKNPKAEYNLNDILSNWASEKTRSWYMAASSSVVSIPNTCIDEWSWKVVDKNNCYWYAGQTTQYAWISSFYRSDGYDNKTCVSNSGSHSLTQIEHSTSSYKAWTGGTTIWTDASGISNCQDGMSLLGDLLDLCKFPELTHTDISGVGWNEDRYCWLENNLQKQMKVSDLEAHVVWSSEFDAEVSAVDNSEQAAANPFSQSRGSAENKNSESSNRNNSNSQNLFPILATAGAVAGSVYLASRPGNRIIIKNFKSGFTEYGKAQIQKTKDFFAFLEEEKNGYWVKKWKAEEEARQRAAAAKQEAEQREKFQQVIFDVNKVEKDFKNGKITKGEFDKKIQNLNQTAININETSSNKKVYESSMGPLFGIATMTFAGFGLAGPHGAAAGFIAGTVATLGTYLLTQTGAMNSVGNSIYGTLNSVTGILSSAGNWFGGGIGAVTGILRSGMNSTGDIVSKISSDIMIKTPSTIPGYPYINYDKEALRISVGIRWNPPQMPLLYLFEPVIKTTSSETTLYENKIIDIGRRIENDLGSFSRTPRPQTEIFIEGKVRRRDDEDRYEREQVKVNSTVV